ncbi:MAG TPA: hypothetical protein VNB68_05005, partial [Nitrososphaeraceae archaeon]|nr:hypothetical protein [Nitrososphaeraceae archaeon]
SHELWRRRLRSCMYNTNDARRGCESGSESVTADDHHKPTFFKPAFYMFAAGVSWCFATSSTKSNCACKSLLASHSSDGLGLK